MKHRVDIRKKRFMEVLKNNFVNGEIVNEAVAPDQAIVYEQVVEEIVFDDIELFEGGIEDAIKAKAFDGDALIYNVVYDETRIAADMIAAALIAEAEKAKANRTTALIGEAVNPEWVYDEDMPYEVATNESANNIIAMNDNSMMDGAANAEFKLIENLIEETWNTDHRYEELMTDDEATIAAACDPSCEECKLIIDHLAKEVEELEQINFRLGDLLEHMSERNLTEYEYDFLKLYKKDLEVISNFEQLNYLEEPHVQTPEKQVLQPQCIKISATSTPMKQTPPKSQIIGEFVANDYGLVVIGPHGTTIAKTALAEINWSLGAPILTRKILMEVFDRETLAFHNLTGKPSPAFMQLDPFKVADIIHLITEHTNLSAKEVRSAISTKCAVENKMYRQREKKRQIAALKLLQKQEEN